MSNEYNMDALEEFEKWFSEQLITYRKDEDMIRYLLRTKSTLRYGFYAGFTVKAKMKQGEYP